MGEQARLHGLMAAFDGPERLLQAAQQARAAGYRRFDAYSPFPVDGLAAAVGYRVRLLPWIVLVCAVAGGLAGFFMQWYSAVVDYPINSGGRPLNSWPAFMIVAFELAILGGTLGGFFGMLALNGLPRLYHPVFNVPDFQLASRDRFYLCIETADGEFDAEDTRAFLEGMEPLAVYEVPA